MALPEIPDWHTANSTGAPGELEDYLALRDSQDAEAVFNLFVKRWVHPSWHPHLADSDDNEAEYVRRTIRAAIAQAACAGFAAGAVATR